MRPRLPVSCLAAAGAMLGLAALVGLWVAHAGRSAYREVSQAFAERRVTEAADLMSAALRVYHRDTGRLPSSLAELTATVGPEGYQGPYLTALPPNPATRKPDWGYDPSTGEITDSTGAWQGRAVLWKGLVAGTNLDMGRMPRITGFDLTSGSWFDSAHHGADRTLYYLFRDTDASRSADLAVLARLRGSSLKVTAVLTASTVGPEERTARARAYEVPFPIVDATAEGQELEAKLGVTETPVTIVCDRAGRRRARIGGALDRPKVDASLLEVRTLDELLALGGRG